MLLRAYDLALDLDGQRVLDGVTFELRGGEWTSLVGPNGAGKSSLLALLAGLLEPLRGRGGRIEWLGKPLAAWPARQRAQQIAWLAQAGGSAGDAEIAARDIVALGRLPRHGLLGSPDANDDEAVLRAMDETESTPFAARRLSSLSGGERQRVLLARALAVEPKLFLFDEPAAHLDAPHQRNLLATFAARARRRGGAGGDARPRRRAGRRPRAGARSGPPRRRWRAGGCRFTRGARRRLRRRVQHRAAWSSLGASAAVVVPAL
ncbi:MAG: ABC transporter ATP-binding protein [Rubrivivax sp.]